MIYMTPVEYEKIVGQILDGDIDLDKLTELVKAEQTRRAEKEARDFEIKEVRDDIIENMLYYIGLVANDPDVERYLDTPAARKDFENILTKMESMMTLGLRKPVVTSEIALQSEVADKIRRWLTMKNITNE